MQIPANSLPTPAVQPLSQPSALRRSAEAMEVAFLSEMLKAAGLGQPSQEQSGGIGEDHFASFMADSYAQALMERGGVGLADSVERALTARLAASSMENNQ